jgi:D-arabinose 1-dehydrogenase-like Zn-dependent alcohol dehydrogenase
MAHVMKFSVISVALVAVIIVLNGYLYLQNRSLAKDIARGDKACAQQLSAIKNEYEKIINSQNAELDQLHITNRKSENRINITRLDEMASYGHQVRAIWHKYEFLLETANLTIEDKKLLSQFLVKREKLNEMVTLTNLGDFDAPMQELTYQLEDIEEYIKDLLKDPVDYRRYNYLKERNQ